jgi:dihydroneopterin aldolase
VAILVVRRIVFEGIHGATAAERQLGWRFEVDLEAEADVGAAERSDKLADTLDYAEMSRIVVEVGTGRPFHLLEALGRAMLDRLGARWPGAAFRLELRKLAPPHCPGRPEAVAVRLQGGGGPGPDVLRA